MATGSLAAVLAGAASFVSLGVPYKYGGTPTGTSASTLATDCSGMVQFLYAKIGVALPRTSEEQANVGTLVASGPQTAQSMANLTPGDLIFYNYEGLNSHVALYAGNGQQYAETHTGTTASLQAVDFSAVSSVRQIVSGDSATAGLGAVGGGAAASQMPEAPSSYSESGNASYAYLFFEQNLQNSGLSEANAQKAASAIVGNLLQESGVNPDNPQKGGPGIGIAQWTNGIIRAGGDQGQQAVVTGNNATDLQAQLQQMWSEMQAPQYSSAMTILKSASGSASALAVAWGHAYEGFGVAGDRGTFANYVYQLATGNGTAAVTPSSLGSNFYQGWVQGIKSGGAGNFITLGLGGLGTTASTAASDAGSAISGLPGDILKAIEGATNWQRVGFFAGGFLLVMIGLVGLLSETKQAGEVASAAPMLLA